MHFLVFAAGIVIGAALVILWEIPARFKLRQDINDIHRNWELEHANRIAANVQLAKVSAEAEIYKINAERYSTVCRRLITDEGGLSIDAFYGPHAIKTVQDLNNAIDEDLDDAFVQSLYDAFDWKRNE